jgi:Xaa-Pro dipeptidase
MALHFSREEFADRRRKASAEMVAQGLHGLLIFRQESMYYLTGYDTAGFSMFQGMYLGADGRLALVTRSADRTQARITSVIEDVRIWVDSEDANPAEDVRDMLADYGCRGQRIGVEYHAYGLTAQRGKMVDAALDGFCEVVDASDLVRLQRLVKSPAELAYVRRSGELADEGLAVANRLTVPGASVGAVYGAMVEAMMQGGGDLPCGRWPMGSGEEALLVRYHTGHGTVAATDQVTFEFTAAYRHYHTALMHVVLTGEADPRQVAMFEACIAALDACEAALVPGATVGAIFDVHARVMTEMGQGANFLNACGYTMGATYPPTWMDWPMLYTGNPQVVEPGMVFFMHMILLDNETGLTMSLGETAIVTEGACEPVNHAPRELIVN